MSDRHHLERAVSVLAGVAALVGPPDLARLALARLQAPRVVEGLQKRSSGPEALAAVVLQEWLLADHNPNRINPIDRPADVLRRLARDIARLSPGLAAVVFLELPYIYLASRSRDGVKVLEWAEELPERWRQARASLIAAAEGGEG